MRDCKEDSPCEDPCCSCCIRFREAWTTGSIYRPGDAVPYNGSSYAAIHWNQNDPPPSSNWALIAAKGETGPAGPQGPTGSSGPEGPTGSTGMTLTAFGRNEVQFGTGGNDFASISLPAGQFIIWATVPVTNVDGDPQSWTIQLSASNDGKVDGGVSGRIAPLEESCTEVVPILARCESFEGTTITFRGFGFNIIAFPNVGGKNCFIVAMPVKFS